MTKISKIQTYDAPPKLTTLAKFVLSTMNPDNELAQQVQRYRETGEAHLKTSLPLAIVGAICEGGHARDHVVKKTGWIALDIDAADNPHLKDAEAVRDAVGNFDFIAFAGLSVSGRGVWALVKIADPEKQATYFKQLQADFEHFGITLDSTKGKNANDKRFYSFDPKAYVADDFEVYDRLPQEQKATRRTFQRTSYTSKPGETRAKVEKLIAKIDTDITGGYKKWSQLGFALEDEFGESGRDYFHAISQYHPEYNRRECDRRYESCLKSNGAGTTIGTFFYECKKNGFTLDRNHAPQRDNGSNAKCETKKLRQNGDTALENYPDEWDEITLEKGSQEYKEATRAMINDASPEELQEFYNLK